MQLNKTGVKSNTINVMVENDRNTQPHMTRNGDKNLTFRDRNCTKNVQSEIELKLLDIFNKRFERIESRIDELATLKTSDE